MENSLPSTLIVSWVKRQRNPTLAIFMCNYPFILWFLSFLFFLRVLGQFLVAFFKVSFLPSMPYWYSGLLPYPILLPTQILIIILQTKINIDISRNKGFFVKPRPKFGKLLKWFSYPYAGIMVIRYIITMYFYPERRWFGEGTIPIIFHFVLAGYLFTWGKFYESISNCHESRSEASRKH